MGRLDQFGVADLSVSSTVADISFEAVAKNVGRDWLAGDVAALTGLLTA
jgi:hypothetical protein